MAVHILIRATEVGGSQDKVLVLNGLEWALSRMEEQVREFQPDNCQAKAGRPPHSLLAWASSTTKQPGRAEQY